MSLPTELEEKLTRFGQALVDQSRARIIVPPQQASTGFWFGGGNMIESSEGELYLIGRYRNYGDSRTGIGAGTRGLELALFHSVDRGETFSKVASWGKADLNVGQRTVLSIEGSALRWTEEGVELYVSTEKDHVGYPAGFEQFLKPGTGVWSIDRLRAESIEELRDAAVESFFACTDPNYLHVKDPFVYPDPNADALIFFVSHPYCWSSSNSGFASADQSEEPEYEFFPRGPSWDVAITRGTALMDVPAIGEFAEHDVTLMFYDGGECVRNLDAHQQAVVRPRGYSCEELGGLAYCVDGEVGDLKRLSRYQPLFVSPHGTGCCRYVDVLETEEGFYATWQQSQPDLSQPLVMNFLPREQAEQILK